MEKSGRPFSVKRTVKWGDCDPAGIIYTPRVFDYLVESLEAWFREVVGVSWMELNWEMNMGMPMVRVECDFVRAPRPDQEIEVEVRVRKLGAASVTYALTGHDGAGQHYFRATLVGCFIARPDFKPTRVPDEFRARIAAYQAACGDG